MTTSPLADPIYRRLFGAQVIALLGTGLATVALALLAYELAGAQAGWVLGTALALKMIAYVTFAPLASTLSHRWPRRNLLISLDLARAFAIGCVPLVSEVWQIYLLITLLSACAALHTPTFQAAIPDLLPDDARYTRALTLSRLAYDLENLLSPALAAMLLTVVSFHALFAANAASFVVSAALIVSVTLPGSSAPHAQRTPPWDGIRNYLRTPRLRGLLALSMATALAGAFVIINTVIYVRGELAGSEQDTALVLAAYGAGSMCIALVLPKLLERYADRPFMLGGALVLGVGLLSAYLARPGLVGLAAIWWLLGCASSLIQTPSARLLKRSSHAGDHSAIFAAQFSLSHACWLVGYLVAGWLGGLSGLDVALAVATIGCLACAAAAVALWPGPDRVTLTHTHDELVHAHPHVHDAHHQHAHDGSEGPEPHSHPHRHAPVEHSHNFVIDLHHARWPTR